MRRLTRWSLCFLLGLVPSAAPGAPADGPGVVVWAAGPFETRAAFDRPIDAALATRLVGTSIGLDETRTHLADPKPPGAEPSKVGLRIAAARLDDGGRTLILTHDPFPVAAVYLLKLPEGPGAGVVPYDLDGVEVTWDDGTEGAAPLWSGWWPAFDVEEARRLMKGSTEHDRGFALLARPGRLTVSALVALPKGKVALRLGANAPIEAVLGGETAVSDDKNRATFALDSTGDLLDLTVTARTGEGGKPLTLNATSQSGTQAVRPLARDRLRPFWAPTTPPPPAPPNPPPFALSGGDPARGAAIFHGDRAKCGTCHKVDGKGGEVGPDLGALSGRKIEDVYDDIANPGARINPGYVGFNVALKDGRVFVGIVRAEGADSVRVTDTDAKTTVVRRDEIEEFRPASTSIMPVGLAGVLSEDQMRDLLAWLTAAKGAPGR